MLVFWMDSWLPARAPFLLVPGLFGVTRMKRRVVRDALHEGNWIRDLRGRVTPALLPSFVRLWAMVNAHLPLTPDVEDSFRWKLTDSRAFTTSSVYRIFFLGSMVHPVRKQI